MCLTIAIINVAMNFTYLFKLCSKYKTQVKITAQIVSNSRANRPRETKMFCKMSTVQFTQGLGLEMHVALHATISALLKK